MATIQIKYSTVPGHVPSGLLLGELAINLPDNILYFVLGDGVTLDSFNFNSPQIVTMGGSDNSLSGANTAFVQGAVTGAKNAVLGTPPSTLNTLQKLAAAINNDPNFSTTINNAIAGTSAGYISYSTPQTLTTGQQAQAQANLGIPGGIATIDGGSF